MPMIKDVTRHVGTGNRGIFLKKLEVAENAKKSPTIFR
jgi:hypothetical protein